jgi:hypothetical protein
MGTKKFDALIRQQCKPINYSNKVFKQLASLWETGVFKWNNLLTVKNISSTTLTYHIQPTDAILVRLPTSRQQNQQKNTTPHGHNHPEIHTSPPCQD